MITLQEYLDFEKNLAELHRRSSLDAIQYIFDILKRFDDMLIVTSTSQVPSVEEYRNLTRKCSAFRLRNLDTNLRGVHSIKFAFDRDLLEKVIGYCYVVECKWHYMIESSDDRYGTPHVVLFMTDPDPLIHLKLVMDSW